MYLFLSYYRRKARKGGEDGGFDAVPQGSVMIREGKFGSSRRIILRWILSLQVYVVFFSRINAQSTPPPDSSESEGSYYHLDKGRAIVVGFLFGLLLVIAFGSVYIHRCLRPNWATPGDSIHRSARDWSRQGGLDPSVVESFPIFVYSTVKEVKIGKTALECAICLSEFKDDEMLRLLPKCSHVFHSDCIDKWLRCRVTCPVCRAKLAAESAGEHGERTESNTEPADRDNSGYRDTEGVSAYQVVIDVDNNDRSQNLEAIQPDTKQNRRLQASTSTGDSMVQLRECTERYTLRVPEEIRKRMVADDTVKRLKTSHHVVLAAEGGSRGGYTRGSEDNNRGAS